jgi:hypothetical protein
VTVVPRVVCLGFDIIRDALIRSETVTPSQWRRKGS